MFDFKYEIDFKINHDLSDKNAATPARIHTSSISLLLNSKNITKLVE